jgi:hypothetical protein
MESGACWPTSWLGGFVGLGGFAERWQTSTAGGANGVSIARVVPIPPDDRSFVSDTRDRPMHTASATREGKPRRNRPSRVTVFATAFVAGAAVAFGVNRLLDVHLAQTRPQVECEPIFVALHSLPQGSPITVWDVALKDWPRAMLPTSALRARDTFDGMVLKHPLREGQPLLAVQLMPATAATTPSVTPAEQSFTAPLPAAAATQAASVPEADLWAPSKPATPKVAALPQPQASRTDVEFVAPEPQQVVSSDQVDTSLHDVLPPGEGVDGPLEQETVAPSEPTLAVVPEARAAPEDTAASTPVASDTVASDSQLQEAPTPGLLPPGEPLYAPVPASPPADLAGALSGVGGLPTASDGTRLDKTASVLKQTPPEALAAATPQQPSASRYLVVPERIAVQADSSFTPPAVAQQPQGQTPAKTTTKAANRSANSSNAAKRPQSQGAAGDRQAPAASARPLGGMFPNLSAGIEAWTGPRKPVASQRSSTTR